MIFDRHTEVSETSLAKASAQLLIRLGTFDESESRSRYDVQLQLPTASEIHICFRSTADGQ